jgi:C4-dicarboxylate transporter
MKSFIILTLAILIYADLRAQHKLEKIWETDTIVAIPESVLPDLKNGILFISLIDGPGWEADGKGGIGKLCLVFLEFQFEEFISKHNDEKVMRILQKSWKKMSEPGRDAALTLSFSPKGRALLTRALGG